MALFSSVEVSTRTMSRVVPVPALAVDASDVKMKLSFLDVQFIARPPIQIVSLFKLAGPDEFRSVVTRLKDSLAVSLPLCLPLARKLVHVEETGDVVVDCSDAGANFFEADVDYMDVHQLVRDEALDVAKIRNLLPELDARVLPAPVFAVQATRLGADGGMALVVSVHHAVLDGRSLGRFVHLWTSAFRGSTCDALRSLGTPYYSREAVSVAHPRCDEFARRILKKVAPNLPVANKTNYYFCPRPGLVWRRIYLDAHDIRSVKGTIDRLASSETGSCFPAPLPVSTFLAVTALCWTAFVRSKGFAPEADTYLTFAADLRTRLRPPLGDGYLGPCVKKCLASVNAGDLLGDAGLLRASQAIHHAVTEAVAAPLDGTEVSWNERVMHVPQDRLAAVAGCPLMEQYKTDFGFGTPVLVDSLPLNHDGRMVLGAGKRDGQVQISVSIDQAHINAFRAYVLGRPRARI